MHSEIFSDKPLLQCVEKRHLPRLLPLGRMRRAIVGRNTTEAVDVLWVSTVFFVGVIDMAVAPLGVLDFQDPGAVLELVASVEFRVIGRVGVPHFPEDF